MIIKGVSYARVSTDWQETEGSSLSSQTQSNLNFASINDLIIPNEYVFNETYSGASYERPQLSKVFKLAEKGLIDFIIFTKRDRIARSQHVYQNIVAELKKFWVSIFYSEEKLTWDPALDSFMWSTIIGFAEWEREQIKLRTMSWRRQFAKNDKWPFWYVPYWYFRDHVTKELAIFKPEKDILLKMIKYYLEDNMTLWRIAIKLTEDNVPPPSMSEKESAQQRTWKKLRKNAVGYWSSTTVQRILYKASIYTWKYIAFKNQFKLIWHKSVKMKDRDKSEWIEINIPKIITLRQAEAILKKMDDNKRFSQKNAVRSYMLQGKMFCDCEAKHHNFVWYYDNKKSLRNYRCNLYQIWKTDISRRCTNNLSGLKIEPVIVDTLREIFTNSDFILEQAETIDNSKHRDMKDRYSELNWLIMETNDKHKRNEELYIEWNITKERFLELKMKLEQKIWEYSDEMIKELEILKSTEWRDEAVKNIGTIIKFLREYIEFFFENASYDDIKKLIGLTVEKIVVPKCKDLPVKIVLKLPRYDCLMDKYYEENTSFFEDEHWKIHKIVVKWDLIPKLIPLDPTKKPLKYRSIYLQDDSNSEDTKQSQFLFLDFLTEYYHQLYKLDQIKFVKGLQI